MIDGKPAIAGGDPVFEDGIGYGAQSIGQREIEAVIDVLESEYITRGPEVVSFESAVADYIDVDHAIAVTSGTAALHIAGLASDLEPGDEVITTPLTFAATANVACHAGAEPVFADVRPDTRNIDPEAVIEQVNDDTEVLIPMHYAGQPVDIEALQDIAEDHNLTVIWDACHALGSKHAGSPIGTEHDMTVFSFHPVKNITTAEGGMVVTNDDVLASRLRSLRSFCMERERPGHEDEPWYQVTEGVGFNYNLNDIQAAIGRVQLSRLEEFKERRDELVAHYNTELKALEGIKTPLVKEGVDPMWHLYAIEIKEGFPTSRADFVRAMHSENIGVQVHYVPLHHHPHFQKEHGYSSSEFPVSNSVYERLVTLPLYPGLSDWEQSRILEAIRRIFEHHR